MTETQTHSNSPGQIDSITENDRSAVNSIRFVEIFPFNRSNQPHPRSGHRAFATETDFWIWGGYHPPLQDNQHYMFSELWRFNYALRQWTLETTTGTGPNVTVASHSTCRHRDFVFVFGGTGYPFGHYVSNQLYVLDLKRRHWTRCELNNQQPRRVYGASMILASDRLYLLCGTDSHQYNSEVYEIFLPTMTCTKIGDTFPETEGFGDDGRYRQEAHLHDNKIYLFGGAGFFALTYSLQNLPVFDIATRSWSFVQTNPDPIHNFPAARKFHSIFPFRTNQIIMFGGAYFDDSIGRHIPTDEHLWTFDFDKLEWCRVRNLCTLQRTYFHAAAINERGEIWSHGGVTQHSTDDQSDRRITSLYKMNTRVLKLSDLSWNYILNCLSDKVYLLQQPEFMATVNIPAIFRERLR